MPINFETTFTQPILARLDAGSVSTAGEWAKLITNAYVNTIKTGAPQGVPFTLPSPVQLGAPYPIGNIFYNTIDAKSRFMENIIKAYFLTEEIKIQKSGIRGLIQTIKQIVQKGKNLRSQIKSLIDQIKQTTKELQELPTTLNELYASIKEEIELNIQKVRELGESLDNFLLVSNDPSLRTVFANEISIYESIRNLEFGFDLQTLQRITVITTATDTAVNQLQNKISNEDAFKAYLMQSASTILKNLYQLVNTAVSPTQYITTYQQLAANSDRAKLIYEMLKRIEFFEKKLQPKIIKLENELKDKKKRLQEQVNDRINNLKKDLEKRIDDLAKKKGEGKNESYKKAKKTLSDYKKKYKTEFKKRQDQIKKLVKISRSAVNIVNKGSSIILGVEQEIQTIGDKIDRISTDAESENKQLIEQFLAQNNLSLVANTITQLVVNNRLNAQSFIELFKNKTALAANYYNQLVTILDKDIPDLLEQIQETPRQQKAIEQQKETSFLKVFEYYNYYLAPEITRLDGVIKDKMKDVKKSIEEKIDTSKKDLTEFGVNLIPVKSDSEDKKTKKLEIEEKKRLIEDKKKKIQRIKKYIACGRQVAQGAITIGKNIAEDQYTYSKNEIAINQIADGYFGFKLIGKEDNTNQTTAILAKKKKFKAKLTDLSIIEGLLVGIAALVNEIKSDPNFVKDWSEKVLNNITDSVKLSTYEKLGEIMNGSITNPKDLLGVAEELTYSITQDINILQNIVVVERKYTQKTLEVFKRIGQSDTRVGQYFKFYVVPELEGSKPITLFLFEKLKAVRDNIVQYINNFIDNAKTEIKDLIKKKKDRAIEDNKQGLDKLKEKATNVKAGIMSLTFSLATRTLWSGATWVGPTGTIFVVNSIGPFKPIKAQVAGGASALVREMARGFENQLKLLSGTFSNPGAGIVPVPFIGYR